MEVFSGLFLVPGQDDLELHLPELLTILELVLAVDEVLLVLELRRGSLALAVEDIFVVVIIVFIIIVVVIVVVVVLVSDLFVLGEVIVESLGLGGRLLREGGGEGGLVFLHLELELAVGGSHDGFVNLLDFLEMVDFHIFFI